MPLTPEQKQAVRDSDHATWITPDYRALIANAAGYAARRTRRG